MVFYSLYWCPSRYTIIFQRGLLINRMKINTRFTLSLSNTLLVPNFHRPKEIQLYIQACSVSDGKINATALKNFFSKSWCFLHNCRGEHGVLLLDLFLSIFLNSIAIAMISLSNKCQTYQLWSWTLLIYWLQHKLFYWSTFP